MDPLVLVGIDERDAVSLERPLDLNLVAMHDGSNGFCAPNLRGPRADIATIVRFHDRVDEAEHLRPAPTSVARDHRVVAVIVARRDNRAVVPPQVELPDLGKNGGVRAQPDLGGVKEGRRCRKVQVAESAIGSSVDPDGRDLHREKDHLMAPAEEFSAKIDVVQERTTEIGHFIREEEDLHCMRGKTGF